jgi:hypothetical protein
MSTKPQDFRKKVRSFAISDADWAEAQKVADEVGAARGRVYTRSSLVADALRERIAQHKASCKTTKASVKQVNLTAQPEDLPTRRSKGRTAS